MAAKLSESIKSEEATPIADVQIPGCNPVPDEEMVAKENMGV